MRPFLLSRRQAFSRLNYAWLLSATAMSAVCYTEPAFSQQVPCADAVAQLQNYVAQVNMTANVVYQRIPMQCGYNGYCQQQQLAQLQGWYAQQAAMVNGWYGQIVRQCSGRSPPGPGRLDRRGTTQGAPPALDEDAVNDIEVDDQDKTVRIRIPDNPRGFR